MTEYDLYVESGPRRRKTMVHVLEFLGCVAQGPTTDEALEATPEAIREYLRLLQRHGEAIDPEAPFTTRIAAHVTEGSWIGQGDPAAGFAPDFQPLAPDDLRKHLRRLGWLRDDLLALVRGLPRETLVVEPETGRSIYHILEHVSEAQAGYLRYLVGKVDGLSDAQRRVRESPDAALAGLADVWEITLTRLDALTDAERTAHVPHGQLTWTARRCLRRSLEHSWEHLREIEVRLR